MKILQKSAAYVVLYILLMVPTYILPYFGSNSLLLNTVGMVFGFGPSPQWWAHVWFIVALVVMSWCRSEYCTHRWLPIFPVLAGVFDMTPVLNQIPLIPTIMNLFGIIFGVTLLSDRSKDLQPTFRNQRITLGVWTLITVIGVTVKLATIATVAATSSTRTTVEQYKTSPKINAVESKSTELPATDTSRQIVQTPATSGNATPPAPSSTLNSQSAQASDPQSKAMLNKANKTLDSLLK